MKVEDMDLDAETANIDAEEKREAAVVNYIVKTFARLGIQIADQPGAVSYAEYPDKSVAVMLDDQPTGFRLEQLYKLYETGLSDHYYVVPFDQYHLRIEFTLSDTTRQMIGA
jgi:hypothetical protein